MPEGSGNGHLMGTVHKGGENYALIRNRKAIHHRGSSKWGKKLGGEGVVREDQIGVRPLDAFSRRRGGDWSENGENLLTIRE